MLPAKSFSSVGLAFALTLAALDTVPARLPEQASPRAARTEPSPARDYPIQPVSFNAVHLDDVFWAPRIETNRTATIPAAFEQCELTGRVDLFVRAAKALAGQEHDMKA